MTQETDNAEHQPPSIVIPVTQPVQELRVANATNVHDLATSIVRHTDEGKFVTLSCIGVGSLAQGTKAVIIANGKLSAQGKVLVRIDHFGSAHINDSVERTTIRVDLHLCRLGFSQ